MYNSTSTVVNSTENTYIIVHWAHVKLVIVVQLVRICRVEGVQVRRVGESKIELREAFVQYAERLVNVFHVSLIELNIL